MDMLDTEFIFYVVLRSILYYIQSLSKGGLWLPRLTGSTALPGFVGCVHRLRVSGRDLIPASRGRLLESRGVRPCNPYNLARLVCP